VQWQASETNESLPENFERLARMHPSRTALGSDAWQPTYEELNARAHALLRRGGASGDRVAILMRHDAPQIAALISIFKAGRTAVVLNPGDPPSRLIQLRENAEAGLILTDETNRGLAGSIAGQNCGILSFDDHVSKGLIDNPNIGVSPDAIAILTYTSGSTGVPKAVMKTHRQLVHNSGRHSRVMEIVAEDRVALLSSLSGGQGLNTTWFALANGASLWPFPTMEKGVTGLAGWLIDHGITVYPSSPSLFRHFVRTLDDRASFQHIRVVKLGSEHATSEDFAVFKQRFSERCMFVHTLGGSETGTVASSRLWPGDIVPEGRLAVGKIADGMEVLLLDDHGKPVGPGKTGAIVVRSRYIAAGYWRNEALTAERFSQDPADNGIRIFRSGDLGGFNAGGQLEFRGRGDAMLKIRGYRVEPSAVEEALLRLPGVEKAVICGVLDGPEQRTRLAAYILLRSGQTYSTPALRELLLAVLPSYMIPSSFQILEAFPLTPHGKIDREALQRKYPPVCEDEPSAERPETVTESLLADIWAHEFKLPRVGRRADFFNLGGDSLIAAVVAAKIYDEYGIELNLGMFTDHPVLSDIAAAIDELRGKETAKDTSPLVRVSREGPLALSFSEERTWMYSQTRADSAGYTMAHSYRILGPLDAEVLRECLGAMARRHEILRTTFPVMNGRPAPFIHPPAPVPLPILDYSGAERPEDQARLLHKRAGTLAFDVAKGPLVLFSLVKIRDGEHWLLRASHHILSDARSWNIYFRELALLYEARLDGRPPPLPDFEPLQYVDYAAWQRDAIRPEKPAFSQAVAWWRQTLAGLPPSLELPFKRPAPVAGIDPGEGDIRGGLDPEVAHGLNELRRKAGATYFISRLAVIAAIVAAETGARDLTLGTYATNRTHTATQTMIGFFTNLVILRLRYDPKETFQDWIVKVRDAVADAAAYSYFPFEELRRQLRAKHDPMPELTALFSVGQPPVNERFAGLELTSLEFPHGRMPWGFTFECQDSGEHDRYRVAFDARIYDPARVHAFIERYRHFAAAVSRQPETPMVQLLMEGGFFEPHPA